jgi:hypothetical protein
LRRERPSATFGAGADVATTFRIDGRTGFDRLWILISVLWIGLWGVFAGRAAYEQAPDIEHLRLADINGPTGLRLDYTILSEPIWKEVESVESVVILCAAPDLE